MSLNTTFTQKYIKIRRHVSFKRIYNILGEKNIYQSSGSSGFFSKNRFYELSDQESSNPCVDAF